MNILFVKQSLVYAFSTPILFASVEYSFFQNDHSLISVLSELWLCKHRPSNCYLLNMLSLHFFFKDKTDYLFFNQCI